MDRLKGKHIVLGITGSIAAYKACTLVRLFVREGAEVQVVITPSGKEFVTPLTLATLSQRAVVSEFFDKADGSWHSHVELGLWADVMVIAPCTASTLAKMAHGMADNMLLTTYLSMRAPIVVAPAMDLDMFAHPATQDNLRRLMSLGHHVVQPADGFLASGLEGKGRMEEPERIVEAVVRLLHADTVAEQQEKSCTGRGKILITAGPTYEKIDPVRFVGNYSSGKMGFALAECCRRKGFEVYLVAGPVALSCHPDIRRIDVESSAEMYAESVRLFPEMRAAILCAAVADFTPVQVATTKIKREGDEWMLPLKPTKDIAAELGGMKRSDQRLVAFALETDKEETHAREKLIKKNADFIVLNSTRIAGTTFQSDENQITIIKPEGQVKYEKKHKSEVACDIVDELCAIL